MIDLVYFGTSNHSVILLNALKNNPNINLKLVVTKPDKPIGRSKELTPMAVKTWCLENNVNFITPLSLKKELADVKNKLQKDQCQIAVVADYGLIIPKELLDVFSKGVVNVHFSLLPKYRGSSPVTYALLNDDTQTGITFLLTEATMDTGDILKQIPFTIDQDYNDDTSYQELFKLASQNLVDVLKAYLNGTLIPVKQEHEQATYTTPSSKFDRTTFILKEDAKINFAQSPIQIERAIRAFYPWPVAHTNLSELAHYLGVQIKNADPKLKVKIHKAHLQENSLVIDKLQIEGKSVTDFLSFKNGYLK